MNSSSDGFITTIDTERFGKLIYESKFSDDGANMVRLG
jgi:hypothetical protein